MQQKRRPHNKSRKGCRNCKRRHVKCDEEGPPCGNCFVRGAEDCMYGNAPSGTLQDSSLVDSPAKSINSNSELTQRIELELMHRWTVSTYESMCTIPEDERWLKNSVPLWGLSYDFLLSGVFSLAALEIALCGGGTVSDDSKVYYKHALEYYDRASRSYRTEVTKVTRDNIKSLFAFSSLAALINFAIPQCESLVGNNEPQDILGRMIALFSLLRKAAHIAAEHFDMLMADPEAGPAIKAGTDALEKDLVGSLPSEIENALARATTVIEKGVRMHGEESLEGRDEEEIAIRIQAHRTTLAALRMCFIEDAKKMIKGLCIAFPSLAAPDFPEELDRSEPLAMFLMLHWGVLLHHLGRTIWWAKGVGKRMVLEISDSLIQSQAETRLGQMPEWREGVAWAREEVERDESNDVMVMN